MTTNMNMDAEVMGLVAGLEMMATGSSSPQHLHADHPNKQEAEDADAAMMKNRGRFSTASTRCSDTITEALSACSTWDSDTISAEASSYGADEEGADVDADVDAGVLRENDSIPYDALFPMATPLTAMVFGSVVVFVFSVALPGLIWYLVNNHVPSPGGFQIPHKHGDYYSYHTNEMMYTPISHYLLDGTSDVLDNQFAAKVGFPMAGLATLTVIIIRFWPVSQEAGVTIRANAIAAAIGIVIGLFMFLPGLFHMTRDLCAQGATRYDCISGYLHDLGGHVSFGVGIILGFVQSVDMYRQVTNRGQRRYCFAQVLLAKCALIYISTCLFFAAMAAVSAPLSKVFKVLPREEGRANSRWFATSEWLTLLFIFYFVLFMYPWMWMEFFRQRAFQQQQNQQKKLDDTLQVGDAVVDGASRTQELLDSPLEPASQNKSTAATLKQGGVFNRFPGKGLTSQAQISTE